MPKRSNGVRWPGRPWSTIAKVPGRAATLRVRTLWSDDLFATPMPRVGDLGLIWDRMWDRSQHTFLVSTRCPDRLARFVLRRAYKRSFGWTDLDRPPLGPGSFVSFDDLYYRNQCGYVGSGDWECRHPENESRCHDESCHEYQCPISYNVQDRKTLRKIGVADEYEYDAEGFAEDSTSWQEIHSRPRHGMARNVWLGFRADTQEQFEAGARIFRGLRQHLGPYPILFAETSCPVTTRFGYHADSEPNWSPEDRYDFGDGGYVRSVPFLNWIVEAGVARGISWTSNRPAEMAGLAGP